MNKIGFVFCLVLFFSFSFQVNAQWFWQNPLPQANTIGSISFVNENTGFVVGVGGALIKTTDSGESWININMPSKLFSDIYFVNESVGYIVGYCGVILKTTNGGNEWFDISIEDTIHLTSVYFTSSDTGFCVGENGIIMGTEDGGGNWDSTILASTLATTPRVPPAIPTLSS